MNAQLQTVIANQPYPLLFATISGAHLYGFPSVNSDYDLRGVHILPIRDVIGLKKPRETIEVSQIQHGLEIDLVTHDAQKFFTLLLKRNGYVLEQLHSPLIVHTTPEHVELKEMAGAFVTKHHAHHYLGFSQNQWKLFQKDNPPRIKPLLYVFRVLLTGIHLMRTGVIEANLAELNQAFNLPYLADLMEQKRSEENATLPDANRDFYQAEFECLQSELEAARDKSSLPDAPSNQQALNDLLIRLRFQQFDPKF